MGGLSRALAVIAALLKKGWIIRWNKSVSWTGYTNMSNGKRWTYFEDSEVVGLNEEFVAKLEMARKYAGVEFIITSGKRNQDSNSTVGGVQDSAHLQGRAVDLRSRDSHTHFKIVQGAIKAEFRRIGVYHDSQGSPSHIHLDDSSDLPQEVLWLGESK